jgi:hypothetical protein
MVRFLGSIQFLLLLVPSILFAHAPTFQENLSLKGLVQKSSNVVYAECSLVTEKKGELFSYYNFNVVETLSEKAGKKSSGGYAEGETLTLRVINIGTSDKIKRKNNLPVFKVGKGYFLFLKEKSQSGYPIIAGGFARGVIPKVDRESASPVAYLGKSEKSKAGDSSKILTQLNQRGASLQQIKDLMRTVHAKN